MPHEKLNIYFGMSLTLGFAALVFTMRATFFAPVDEIEVPREISGAAMSIACILVILHNFFVLRFMVL